MSMLDTINKLSESVGEEIEAIVFDNSIFIDVDGEECHVDDEYVGVPLTVEIASCFLNIIKGIDFYPCELEFGKVIPTIVIYTKTWVFITAKFDGGNTFIKVTRNPFLG